MFCGDSEDSPPGIFSVKKFWRRKPPKKDKIDEEDEPKSKKKGGKKKAAKDKKKNTKDNGEQTEPQMLVEAPAEERPINIELFIENQAPPPAVVALNEDKLESDPPTLPSLEPAKGGQDAATSISRLLSSGESKELVAIKDRRTSSLVLDLTPEQQMELLKRLRDSARNDQDVATSISRLFSDADVNEQEAIENRRTSSLLLHLSPEQQMELLERLQESNRNDQDTAKLSDIYLTEQAAAKARQIFSMFLDFTPEQQKEILARLQEYAGNDQDAENFTSRLFSSIDLTEQGAIKARRISSMLLDLTPEQQIEMLVRLQEAVGNDPDAAKSSSRLSSNIVLTEQGAAEAGRTSSMLLDLTPEQQKEMLLRLQEAELVNAKGASPLVIPLTPEQQREMLERSIFANGEGVSLLALPLKTDQRMQIAESLREGSEEGRSFESANEDWISSLLIPLAPEAKNEMLERLRMAEVKSQSSEFAKDKGITSTSEQLNEKFERLQEVDFANNGVGISPLFSDLTPEQKNGMLKTLRKVNGKRESPDISASPKVSPLLPYLTLEQRLFMQERLREIARMSQDVAESTLRLAAFLDDMKNMEVSKSTSRLSAFLGDMKNKEVSTSTSRLSFLSNENGVISRYAATSTTEISSSLLNENKMSSTEAGRSTSRLSHLSNENDRKRKKVAKFNSRRSSSANWKYMYPSRESVRKFDDQATFSESRQSIPMRDEATFVRLKRRTSGSALINCLPPVVEPHHKGRRKTPKRLESLTPRDSCPQQPCVQIDVSNGAPVLVKCDSISNGLILMPAHSERKCRSKLTEYRDPQESEAKRSSSEESDNQGLIDDCVITTACQIPNCSCRCPPLLQHQPLICKADRDFQTIVCPLAFSCCPCPTDQPASTNKQVETEAAQTDTNYSRSNTQCSLSLTSSLGDAPTVFCKKSLGIQVMKPSTGADFQASRAGAHPLAPSTCCSPRSYRPRPGRICPMPLPVETSPVPHHISPIRMEQVFNCQYTCPLPDCRRLPSSHPSILRPQKDSLCNCSEMTTPHDSRPPRIKKDPKKGHLLPQSHPGDLKNASSSSIPRNNILVSACSPPTMKDCFTTHDSSYCQRCSGEFGSLADANISCGPYDICNGSFLPQMLAEHTLMCTYRYSSCLEDSSSDTSIRNTKKRKR